MVNKKKIYDTAVNAANAYTTDKNRPLMEAVKQMANVCFAEATFDMTKKCPLCHGNRETVWGLDRNGKPTIKLPVPVPCDYCNGTGYVARTDEKDDLFGQTSPEDNVPEVDAAFDDGGFHDDILSALSDSEFGGGEFEDN